MPRRDPIWVTVAITRSRWPVAFPATPPLVFAVRPGGLSPFGALLPPADLSLLLGQLLVARIDDPPRGPALLGRPSQLAPLPRRAPRRQVGRVQPLPPQQRPDRARGLPAVGLPDDLPRGAWVRRSWEQAASRRALLLTKLPRTWPHFLFSALPRW